MANTDSIQTFVLIILLSPPISMWTDYQTVSVLAYTRMMENGSIDQAVVILVNEAIFAYFDQANQTFVLRPSASGGFSVLDDSDRSFCKYEVLAGFYRQTDYLKKLEEETKSSKPLLARPSVNVYSEFPEINGKANVLYCYLTGFYNGDVEINFFLNGHECTEKAESSDLMYGEDWTFRQYKYMNISPQPGDEYTCEVRHSSMTQPKITVWRPEVPSSTLHFYWVYTLPVGILLGIIASVLILRRKRHSQI